MNGFFRLNLKRFHYLGREFLAYLFGIPCFDSPQGIFYLMVGILRSGLGEDLSLYECGGICDSCWILLQGVN